MAEHAGFNFIVVLSLYCQLDSDSSSSFSQPSISTRLFWKLSCEQIWIGSLWHFTYEGELENSLVHLLHLILSTYLYTIFAAKYTIIWYAILSYLK